MLGKPEQFARYYYEHGADELLYIDAVASLYERNSLLPIVEQTARETFIPLTVGGGLRTLDDIRDVLRAGADKVSLNTGAIRRPQLVSEAARKFGSSSIVVSIDAIWHHDGWYEAQTDNGREGTGVDAVEWAVRASELGAGELLVTSIDREGTGTGYDLALTRTIAESVPIPVIACGGAGTMAHLSTVITEGKADAVSLASMFHYRCLRDLEFEGEAFAAEGNTEFLRSRESPSRFEEALPDDLKEYLLTAGIETRPGGPR